MKFIAKNSRHYASVKPTAFVTKGKQRVKQYSETVYLKDGDEFEMELFNPTQKTILAKIKINGEYLSSSGLIMRPGQRMFLERFIDVDKKLVYSTYEIDGDDVEVKNAIKNNGNVAIEFYNESLPNWSNNILINTGTSTTNITRMGGYPSTHTLHDDTQPYWKNIGNSVNLTSNFSNSTSNVYFSSTSMETGRIESGEKSNQSLITNNNFTFEWFTFHTVNWKILPFSQKPIEVSDLKKYCHSCGCKIKKSTYKFCPNCGAKLD
jgi:hypothetical protein